MSYMLPKSNESVLSKYMKINYLKTYINIYETEVLKGFFIIINIGVNIDSVFIWNDVSRQTEFQIFAITQVRDT